MIMGPWLPNGERITFSINAAGTTGWAETKEWSWVLTTHRTNKLRLSFSSYILTKSIQDVWMFFHTHQIRNSTAVDTMSSNSVRFWHYLPTESTRFTGWGLSPQDWDTTLWVLLASPKLFYLCLDKHLNRCSSISQNYGHNCFCLWIYQTDEGMHRVRYGRRDTELPCPLQASDPPGAYICLTIQKLLELCPSESLWRFHYLGMID
jgi:hypothetical protein